MCNQSKHINSAKVDDLKVISATCKPYFPGTGIGKGEHFELTIVNATPNTIQLDSLQTKLHCITFDGNPRVVSKDTAIVSAFGLTINHDLFPDIPKKVFKGDSTLKDGGKIYYTEKQTNKTLIVSEFEKIESKFYE